MDPLDNPFSPGAGNPPPELSGRETDTKRAELVLNRIKRKYPEKSFLFVGLRGVGKTVMLRHIEGLAKEIGYKTIFIEASEKKSLASFLIPSLRELLYSLDRKELVVREVKRAFRVLKSFAMRVKHGDAEFSIGLDVDPETGTADSGDLEHDLPSLFEVVAEAAAARDAGIAVIIDELQYLSEEELSALIMATHRISQKALPLVLVGAGLPQLVGNAGKSKSYAERLFDFPPLGPLKKEEVAVALQKPAASHGAAFDLDAVEEIVKQTAGYPYFIQEWGYHSWNCAESSPISLEAVKMATPETLKRLDESFFRVRFDRLTSSEKKYLLALAELDAGSRRSSIVADKLGKPPQSLSLTRNNLIKKGMIYSPSHGDTEFTVPLFDDFMKRTMSQTKN